MERSRRDFLKLLSLSIPALLAACQTKENQPTPTPLPYLTLSPEIRLPTASHTPQPTEITPEATEPPVITEATSSPEQIQIHDFYLQAFSQELLSHPQEHRLRLHLIPLTHPDLFFDFGGNDIQPAASTIKAPILIYSLLKHPNLSLLKGTDAYRMIVYSNNGATARILDSVSTSPETSLDEFNLFLHNVLRFPNNLGLTLWGYPPVNKARATTVIGLKPPPYNDQTTDGFANPINLTALSHFYFSLENQEALYDLILSSYHHFSPDTSLDTYSKTFLENLGQAKVLLSIPDSEYQPPLERALIRASSTYPSLNYSFYGKNGAINPDDWQFGYRHVNDAGVLTTNNQSFLIAYSTNTYDIETFIDLALEYCLTLSQAS